MEFHDATDTSIPFADILILGDSGGGKTQLAKEMPFAFFFDVEGGAHHTGCDRVTFPKEGASYQTLLNMLKQVARLEQQDDGLLHWKPSGAPKEFKIGTIVIDSLDALQEITGMTITKRGMQYWGEMLDKMQDIANAALCSNCHVVFVAHTGQRSSLSDMEKQQNKPDVPKMDLDLGGKIKNRLPAWVDLALHVVVKLDGTREVLTKPQIIDGRSFYAKDRYNFYNGRTYTINFKKDGHISNGILDPILSHCTGGARLGHVAMALEEAKDALIKAAVDKGITKGRRDIPGMQLLIALLHGACLTPDDALAKRDECLKVIEGYKADTVIVDEAAKMGKLDFGEPPAEEGEE